jgi:lipopolysaccharide exporter
MIPDEPADDSTPPNAAPSSSLGIQRQVVKSFAWAAASFGGNRLLVFASTLVLARLLAPRDFGVVAVGVTITMYLEAGLDLGLGSSVVYEQEEGITPRVQTAFTLNLIVAAFLTVVGIVVAPQVAAFFQVPGEVAILRTLFLYFLLRGAGQVQDAVLKRDLQFKKRTAADLASGVVRVVVSVALAAAGYGAWAIVWGLLAAALVSTAMKWAQVRFRPQLRLDRAASATLLRFGLAVVALRFLAVVAEDFDYLVVGRWLGPTQLGLYTLAYRLPELLISNVYWIFSHVAFAAYSRVRSMGVDAFRSAMLRALRLTTLFGFSVGVGLALTARDAVPLLFSAKWTPAVGPMVLISLAMGLAAVGFASGDIFAAMGRPGLLLKLNAPLTVVRFVAFVLVAPHGIVAVAAVHLGFNLVYPLIRLAIANRILHSSLRENLQAMRPALCSVAGIVVFALPVRLLTEPGLPALLLTCGAGVVGAMAAVAVGAPSTFQEVRALAREAVAR